MTKTVADQIQLYNTLSGKKEPFLPLDGNNVKMYVCGPTVYERAHLGNARSAVAYDILFRFLQQCFPKVTYVRNITDVDDKIIAQAKSNRQPIAELTTLMTEYYHQDLQKLNCLPPSFEPKVTGHINDMIALIEQLVAKKHAYVQAGHVLFAVDSYRDYGSLAHRKLEEMIAGARVEVAPYKQNPCDFVLWKPSSDEERDASFPSPWGWGRPGWHIECSAMSKHYLGDTFDIHGGGADLVFPHHENEVAQSVCANDKPYAKFWLHNGFLTVGGHKMSKSLGNFMNLHQAIEQEASGPVLRYFYLTAHYRKPLDYNDKALHDAKVGISKLREAIADATPSTTSSHALKLLADDLNTPEVLAYMHQLMHQINSGEHHQRQELAACATLLGIDWQEHSIIPHAAHQLAEQRQQARLLQDWQTADALRLQLADLGYIMQDQPGGKYKLLKSS